MRIAAASGLILALLLPAPPVLAAPAAPVVVELFTSQGCNSCPPADALLQKLAARPDVLALGFHVDYWNYLGWPDTLALHAATERQQAYAKALGEGYVYTPEMVIAGAAAVLGSDPGAVDKAIAKAAAAPRSVALRVTGQAGGTLTLDVPAGTATASTLWLIGYDAEEKIAIKAGENAGHTIDYVDAVRVIRHLDSWSGQAARIALPPAGLKGATHWAVLLQQGGDGPILAAIRLPD